MIHPEADRWHSYSRLPWVTQEIHEKELTPLSEGHSTLTVFLLIVDKIWRVCNENFSLDAYWHAIFSPPQWLVKSEDFVIASCRMYLCHSCRCYKVIMQLENHGGGAAVTFGLWCYKWYYTWNWQCQLRQVHEPGQINYKLIHDDQGR